MKYRDLISFEPIDSVKVLRDAEDLESARRDVETLVVSPRLAEQLTERDSAQPGPRYRSRRQGDAGRRQLWDRQNAPHVGGVLDPRTRRAGGVCPV